jgi:hypothetical protein
MINNEAVCLYILILETVQRVSLSFKYKKSDNHLYSKRGYK